MTEQTPPGRAGEDRTSRRNWMSWLLAVSLGFNLLFAGAVVGHFLGRDHGRHHHHWHRGGLHALEKFASTLPADRRSALVENIEKARSKLGTLRGEARKLKYRARDLLRQDPFDVEAFRTEMMSGIDTRIEGRKLAADALTDAVKAMTPGERKAFADFLPRKHRKKR